MDGIAFHTPDYDGNAPVVCRRLALPSFLWPLFNGAFGELLDESRWYQFGDMAIGDVVQAFQAAFDDMGQCSMIGQIVIFSTLTLPDNVLLCDGSQFDPLLFPRLYDHLQSDTLPDLRDRFILGYGNNLPGDIGGEETHTLNIPEMPEHWHSYTPPMFNVDVEPPAGAPDLLAAGVGVSTPTGSSGGGQPHNNMPPYHVIVFGIVAK